MYYLLHQPKDLETVKEEILPLFGERSLKMLSYPQEEEVSTSEEDVLILYLPDKELRKFIPQAAEKKQNLAILPHPENKYTSKGLGLSTDLKVAVEEVLEAEKPQFIDLLFCNDKPVFQSVNIGNIFALRQQETKNNLWSEVVAIVRNIRRASRLSHHSYEFTADGDKIVSTSALGIVVVEHASGSVISNRLLQETSIKDGTFHTFIMAPQNQLSLLWFFLRSLWPSKKTLSRLPSFIGKLKTSNLTITNEKTIEYTRDGEKETADVLELTVKRKHIFLLQKSEHEEPGKDENGKKSLKTDGLPTGEAKEELIKRKLPILPRASAEQFADLFKVLRESSRTSSVFLVMMILSTLIASFGLFGNSSPVIIGAMILAPIIAPIVSFSMGMVRYDVKLLKEGLGTIAAGTLVCLLIAAGVSIIIPIEIITPEMEARLSPTLLDMGIAVASGIAAAYAHAKEGIAKSLAGVAIAVALVPPLSVAGIGLGWWEWQVFSGAILLYFTNLAGIILFAGLTFLLLGFAPFKRAKMGLIYTAIILGIIAVPLSLSFNRIMTEARITRSLEGLSIEHVVLRDVKLRFGEPLIVSLKLVGPKAIGPDRIEIIKKKIEEKIHQPVVLEVVSAMTF